MAEYNTLYLDLRKRLTSMKVKMLYSTTNLNDETKGMFRYIDSLLKELDDKYSEERLLDELETKVETLESNFK